jgi:acyl-coenzyme A thioesterase PaaI-like protein
MNDIFLKIVEKARHSQFFLWLLNAILLRAVPFNRPHGLKIVKLTQDSIEVKIPYRKANMNHIKGLHACVLATATEYAMGVLLMSHLNPSAYRIIIQSLRVTYHYQGKTDCVAKFLIPKDWLEQQIVEPLRTKDAVVVDTELKTFDFQQRHICTGEVSWQIKHRSQVKTH